jgi:hypothetical protein
VTIVPMEELKVLHSLSVRVSGYPVCEVHLLYYVVICDLSGSVMFPHTS